MANTLDPRDFYQVTQVVLMPSLWRESLGRVPIEAMARDTRALESLNYCDPGPLRREL
jgi:glycosyltransferase involved in cell wall biosynthesis